MKEMSMQTKFPGPILMLIRIYPGRSPGMGDMYEFPFCLSLMRDPGKIFLIARLSLLLRKCRTGEWHLQTSLSWSEVKGMASA